MHGHVAYPSDGLKFDNGDHGRQTLLCIAKTTFDRGMSRLVKAADDARTITLPNTVRDIQQDAFYQASQLRSLITNDGLETLGNPDQQPDCGMFSNTRIECVSVSSSVKKIEDYTFYNCR